MTPVRYTPSVESPEKGEATTADELIHTLLSISKTTLEDEHHALRAVHAKAHGLVKARLIVLENLAPEYAQGLFARPMAYEALVRFSSAPGDLLPDSVSAGHGAAIKVKNVPGEQLGGGEGDTQDFVLANGKAFGASSASAFLRTLKLLASTTDKAEGLKVALSAALRTVETGLEAAGLASATLTTFGGHPAYLVLAEEFYSQTPFRYGDYIAKFGLVPATEAQTSLKDMLLELHGDFDAQRLALRSFLSSSPAAFDFKVQLCTDLDDMPIETPNAAWPEDKSPYVTVARLEIPIQEAYADDMVTAVDTAGAFSPWHGLEAHRPLGAINRVRRPAYEASARFRLEHNGCPVHGEAMIMPASQPGAG